MLLIDTGREVLYQLVGAYFKHRKVRPHILEIGVHRGSNAVNLHQFIEPEIMHLVDSWDSDVICDAYTPRNPDAYWVDGLTSRSPYYRGSIQQQSTLDGNYSACKEVTKDLNGVSIFKCKSIEHLRECDQNGTHYDAIYVDGSHDYEDVLVDLMWASRVLREGGWLMLNDCCFSNGGVKQNLGVLEACGKFIKMSGFRPIAMTRTDWTDVILIKDDAYSVENFLMDILCNSAVGFCQIPANLLAGSSVRLDSKGKANFILGF